MTVTEYFEEWKGFDYFTEMSDDYSVTRRGYRALAELKAKAGNDPVLLEIYTKFKKYDTSLGGSPKPTLEEYMETK